ncbi:MAG: UDPGP type 1 family protein [Opitutales bacterium]|nr:UDPGP type 1 family protein [Opitutales bacterium]
MNNESRLIADFAAAGQGHVFAFWDQLDANARQRLLADASEIDLQELEQLCAIHLDDSHSATLDLQGLEPAPYIVHPDHGGDVELWKRAYLLGDEALRNGKVAAFTVAGGQGTRLGFDAPKGTYPTSPILRKSLFQIFAEKILSASRRYGVPFHWFILTSHVNNADTVAFFEEHNFFGLSRDVVHFFVQGRMPAVTDQGKIILAAKDEIAMTPDGHGGSLRAMLRSGAVDIMRKAGIEMVSYFQVDNPLPNFFDPAFIGFHVMHASDMSSKMIPKRSPDEKIGVFCHQKGKLKVIEYSDLPEALATETDESGNIRFISGSIALHVVSREFIARVGGGEADYALPFHRADKKVPTIDIQGNPVKPEKPNGVKFEMFVFDALPYAKHPVVMEFHRKDEFSPIKNPEGLDSPAACSRDQVCQWTRWAIAAGVPLQADEAGWPGFTWEVSPLFADSQAAFDAAWNALSEKPEIKEGTVLR